MNALRLRWFAVAVAAVGLSSCGSKTTTIIEPDPEPPEARAPSVAKQWNQQLLEAIRNDFARPTVHARNLFHISAAMFDAWSIFDGDSTPYLMGRSIGVAACEADLSAARSAAQTASYDTRKAFQQEAISHAAYRLISHRFALSPGAMATQVEADHLMATLGFDSGDTSLDASTASAAAVGNLVAECYIRFGLQDGSNEAAGYANRSYSPVNPALAPALPGNPNIVDINHWQPLALDTFIDQAGNPIVGGALSFLGAEWGDVQPFALTDDELTLHERGGHTYKIYHDPGLPPEHDDGTGLFEWGFSLVAEWSSHLDPSDDVLWDISPASIGNITNLPTRFEDYADFYPSEGGDAGTGYAVNPKTGAPYEPQWVPRGDYARVLAEFWADGPDSETPPGHWFVILNTVTEHPLFTYQMEGVGPELDPLEWDLKAYFTLGGAMHDAAISAWSIKGWYDYVRPVSALRAMADLGQRTDASASNYHAAGIELVPGLIETVEPGDPLAGFDNRFAGKIKVRAWQGPDYVVNPLNDTGDVGWILMDNWWPYQRPSFVSPPFAGYVSGHSTYSRAAAEVLTQLTGDAFFPGGKSEFKVEANNFLVFEQGPSVDITLEWATYRDASDQCSLSRIWGGIHPPQDDIPGRLIGEKIGVQAFAAAKGYF